MNLPDSVGGCRWHLEERERGGGAHFSLAMFQNRYTFVENMSGRASDRRVPQNGSATLSAAGLGSEARQSAASADSASW